MSQRLAPGGNMPCPACGGVTRVTDTRPQKGEPLAIRRKRLCQSCPNRFPTVEMALTERATTGARIRFRLEIADRYLALNETGQRAVRQLLASLEAARAFAAEPEPASFATGGVCPPGKPYLIGERA